MASAVEVSPGIFLIHYSGPNDDGYLLTVKISSDGTITKLTEIENDTNYAWENSSLKMYEDVYVLAYRNSSRNLVLQTFKVPTNGSSIEKLKSINADNYSYNFIDLERVDHNTLIVGFSGYRADGYIKSFDTVSYTHLTLPPTPYV